MATPHLRNARLKIINLQNELDLNTEDVIMALFLKGAGKLKKATIFRLDEADSDIRLESGERIENLDMIRGKIGVVVTPKDTRSLSKRIELSELSIPVRVQLIDYMLDKFD